MSCQVQHGIEHKFQDEFSPLNGHICPMDDVPVRGHANRRYCSNKCKDRARTITSFGITVKDYRALIDAAGGTCPICKEPTDRWQLDHNHETGKVTGVVCISCNVGLLAYSQHSVSRAQGLLDYLTIPSVERLGIQVSPVGHRQAQRSNIDKVWSHRR